MTEDFAHLDDLQSSELFNIETLYYCEARKCKDAQAYAAGCVMLAAALEANLMAMVTICANHVAACNKLPRGKKKAVKKLLDWNLGELLNVAIELGWLPAGETLGADPKDWPIGAHAQVIRMLRNLIHPGRCLKDFTGYQITADTLTASFKVLDGVYLHLHAALSDRACKAGQ
ncbi:MAG TPA: hypothetical protein VNE82_22460 [Candidatus Binataceae bacterium]|nr:hypothetical protein [Candidatus Binataceae bacterium]